MIREPVPIFGAVNGGLSANYTLDFAADLVHEIPLNAQWQGRNVDCVTLYIDNYNNAASLRISDGNSSSLVPPYSVGSVDIKGYSAVTISAEASSKVNVSVMDVPATKYGFDIRGALPSSLTNDPLWASVRGMFHFDQIFTDTTLYNTVNKQYGGSIGTSPNGIVYSPTIFGSGCFMVGSDDNSNNSFNISAALTAANAATIEFIYQPTLFQASKRAMLVGQNSGGGMTGIINIEVNSSGVPINLCVGTAGSFSTYVDALVVPYTFEVGKKYHIALSSNSSNKSYLYVNGSVVGTVNTTVFSTVDTTFYFGSSRFMTGSGGKVFAGAQGYYDEFRITSATRYISPKYDIQTAPFLDQ